MFVVTLELCVHHAQLYFHCKWPLLCKSRQKPKLTSNKRKKKKLEGRTEFFFVSSHSQGPEDVVMYKVKLYFYRRYTVHSRKLHCVHLVWEKISRQSGRHERETRMINGIFTFTFWGSLIFGWPLIVGSSVDDVTNAHFYFVVWVEPFGSFVIFFLKGRHLPCDSLINYWLRDHLKVAMDAGRVPTKMGSKVKKKNGAEISSPSSPSLHSVSRFLVRLPISFAKTMT